MLPVVETLASAIEDAWARVGYAEDAFCEIVASNLAQPLDLDFSTLARSICDGMELPRQRRIDQGFGQPALTLHHGERFLIEALCWHNGAPSIHQHSFSGAFRVMTGHSAHSRYSFADTERVGPLMLGELRLESFQILDQRSIVEIRSGRSFIHSAFHLDSPSMTLVVRTHQTAEPELCFLPPGVAYDPSARSQTLHKRLQLLDTLNLTQHESYGDCVRAAIDSADLYDGMAIMMRVGSHRVDEPTFLGFTERFGNLHGPRIVRLISALVEERRRSTILRLRSTVIDQDARFFLASLLSFSRRSDLLDAMEQRYGDPAIAREHIANGVSGLLGGDRDRQIVTTTATHALLDGVPARSFPERAARSWRRAITAEEGVKLERLYEQLSIHPLLKPLLDESGA